MGRAEASGWSAGDVGSFVTTGNGLGIGRLVAVEPDGTAVVRYFRGPSIDPYVEYRPQASELEPVVLSAHTRIYIRTRGRWAIGRIDGQPPEGDRPYVVAFPNSDGRQLTPDQFDVRWSRPIDDPFEILAVLGGDSPVVYEPRLGIIAGWYRQRAAAVAAEGLSLGSVELHDHQLTVVRRVAEDATRRYLLADEVGLGKTIEAGALIWQCLDAKPDARVLVISPGHLRQQWADELTERFRVDGFQEAWLRIRAHDDPDSWPLDPVDLLVVDEAHHLTRAGTAAVATLERLAEIAHRAREVLLLSATPVRSNEAGFLDLLHLLDPANYRRDDLEGFTERVVKRDRLALTFQALRPDLDAFDLMLFGEELEGLFPDDGLLRDLVATAVEADDRSRPDRIGQIREHLSETYRLHHRLLRTRRNDQLEASFAVRGRTRGRPFMIEVEDDIDDARAGLIDDLRDHLAALVDVGDLSASAAADTLAELAARCGSLPQALLELVDDSGDGPLSSWLADQGPNWSAPFAAASSDQAERVAAVLIDRTLARPAGKVVVVSSYTATAIAVADAVEAARGGHRLDRHLCTRSRDENAAAVARWIEDPRCVLLFCDASAEEGINLQAADRMVHLDLPWDVFRLEQRIGRVDRFSGTVKGPVESHVVMCGEQRYAQEWFGFVADACQVFDRSVSSLQHVLADTVRDVAGEVVTGGAAVIDAQLDERREQLAAERDRIAAHDALDAVARTHDEANEALRRADSDGAFGASLAAWFAGVGARLRKPHPGVIELSPYPRPQVSFEFELAIAPWVGRPVALGREAAVEQLVPIAKAGHGLVDAVASHLERSDRGVAYAFFRPAAGVWPPVATFRVDALVLPTPDPNLLVAAEAVGLADWLTQWIDGAMPPRVEQSHVLADGTEVTEERVRRPYDKGAGDRNLSSRPDLFERLAEHLDWSGACERAKRSALDLVACRTSVVDAPKATAAALVVELERRARQLEARRAAGLEADDPAAWAGLATVVPERLGHRVRLLGCGVTFNGDPRLGEGLS